MAELKPAPPAILLVAVFSAHQSAIDWARERIQAKWGPIELASLPYEHNETHYYADEMGEGMIKQFFVVNQVFDPAELPDRKQESNRWEVELARGGSYCQPRPVNIDPGYLTLGKLVLASAKDRAHRIYLRDGVYAEECLYFVGGWQTRPWTYPDYARRDFQDFFTTVRERLKHLIKHDGT